VQGFPTLKLFFGDDRKPKSYNGGRTAKDITAWVKKKLNPIKKEIEAGLEDVQHL